MRARCGLNRQAEFRGEEVFSRERWARAGGAKTAARTDVGRALRVGWALSAGGIFAKLAGRAAGANFGAVPDRQTRGRWKTSLAWNYPRFRRKPRQQFRYKQRGRPGIPQIRPHGLPVEVALPGHLCFQRRRQKFTGPLTFKSCAPPWLSFPAKHCKPCCNSVTRPINSPPHSPTVPNPAAIPQPG